MTDEHVIDLIPAYALDALDPGEAEVVEAHLASCAQCRAELAAYQRVAGMLPLAGRAYVPPARLKSAILRAVEPTPGPASGRLELLQWLRGWLPAHPAWAIASLILIIGLAASNLVLWQQVRGLRREQSGFGMVALAGTNAAPGASGLLVISPDGKYGALIADHLPDLPEGKAYQLWLIQDGQRTNGGLVSSVSHGYAVMRVYSKEPLNQFTSFGVTVEPDTGSPGPTGEKVMGSGG